MYQDLIIKYNEIEDKLEKQSVLLSEYEKSGKRVGILDFKNTEEYQNMNNKIIQLEKIQSYTDSFLNKFNFKTPEKLKKESSNVHKICSR